MSEFNVWFEKNKDELARLLDQDAEMALFKAYIAGMESVGKSLSEDSWRANPDRMGGQFTEEEIRRSERGGDGW